MKPADARREVMRPSGGGRCEKDERSLKVVRSKEATPPAEPEERSELEPADGCAARWARLT